MEKISCAVISGADPVEGGKIIFRPKNDKSNDIFGRLRGGGGEGDFLFFLKIHSIYDISLIGSLNKSFLDTLRK